MANLNIKLKNTDGDVLLPVTLGSNVSYGAVDSGVSVQDVLPICLEDDQYTVVELPDMALPVPVRLDTEVTEIGRKYRINLHIDDLMPGLVLFYDVDVTGVEGNIMQTLSVSLAPYVMLHRETDTATGNWGDWQAIVLISTSSLEDRVYQNSELPVKSSALYTALAGKQNALTAGSNISIDAHGIISVPGAFTETTLLAGNNITITKQANPSELTDDTVAFWNFNDETATDFLEGAFSPAASYVDSKVNFGKAAVMGGGNGTNGKNFIPRTGDFTFDFLMKRAGDDWGEVSFNSGYANSVYLGSGNQICFRDKNGTFYNNQQNFNSDNTVNITEFNHYAVMRKDGVIYWFVNGVLLLSNADTTDYTNPMCFLVGTANRIAMDEIRLSKGAVYPITGFTPKTTPYTTSIEPNVWEISTNASGATYVAGTGISIEEESGESGAGVYVISATGGASGAPAHSWFKDFANSPTTITTTYDLDAATYVRVFKNGLILEPGSGNDYTMSGQVITFTTALLSTDKVLVEVY